MQDVLNSSTLLLPHPHQKIKTHPDSQHISLPLLHLGRQEKKSAFPQDTLAPVLCPANCFAVIPLAWQASEVPGRGGVLASGLKISIGAGLCHSVTLGEDWGLQTLRPRPPKVQIWTGV